MTRCNYQKASEQDILFLFSPVSFCSPRRKLFIERKRPLFAAIFTAHFIYSNEVLDIATMSGVSLTTRQHCFGKEMGL